MGKMLEQGCSILETNFENMKYQIVCELPHKLALIRVSRDGRGREREGAREVREGREREREANPTSWKQTE